MPSEISEVSIANESPRLKTEIDRLVPFSMQPQRFSGNRKMSLAPPDRPFQEAVLEIRA